MARHTMPVILVVVLAGGLPAPVATRAQPQRNVEETGVSGYVLAPDGTPVSGGTVAMMGATTSIERTGRFRVVPSAPGNQQVSVSVSGLAPYRVDVTVPPSKTLKLPVIRLSPATYFRARFLTAAGEPLLSPRLLRQSLDVNGRTIRVPSDDRGAEQIDNDGTLTIGPLPRGITMLAVDMPLLALTRLRDLYVTGAETLFDGGTVTLQPGAVLHVDVVDETGAAVPQHFVSIEDVLSPSPLPGRQLRTDRQGRATFDRLAAGSYRLRTMTLEYCGGQRLSIGRVVAVPGSGMLQTRLVVDGQAAFRLSSPHGPLRSVRVTASPDSGPPSPPAWLRSRSDVPFPPFAGRPMGGFQTSCAGTTDAEGRVTLLNFPPGAARIDVHLLNSTYVRRISVPEQGRELAIAIPDGFVPLRVTRGPKNDPVAGAAITWTGGGARVEATATGNGEALVEAVGTASGTLTITARGFQPAELKFPEPPVILQEIALLPAPVTSLQLRVLTPSGEPVPDAVVELLPGNPLEGSQVAVADAKGFLSFSDVPLGTLRLVARADRFVTAATQISSESRSGIVLTLARGFRVIAGVELPAEAGPHLVRVVNEAGTSMEGLLDIASDRRFEPPGRLSLGPLPPGTYVVELQGAREQRQERVRIVDRDVSATFR